MLLEKESLMRNCSTDLFFQLIFNSSVAGGLTLLSSKQEGFDCINLNSSSFNHYTSSHIDKSGPLLLWVAG